VLDGADQDQQRPLACAPREPELSFNEWAEPGIACPGEGALRYAAELNSLKSLMTKFFRVRSVI
jgi:hypothetical protein